MAADRPDAPASRSRRRGPAANGRRQRGDGRICATVADEPAVRHAQEGRGAGERGEDEDDSEDDDDPPKEDARDD